MSKILKVDVKFKLRMLNVMIARMGVKYKRKGQFEVEF
jgi:hypothetical protein